MIISHNGIQIPVDKKQAQAIINYLFGFGSLPAAMAVDAQVPKRKYTKRKGKKHMWTKTEEEDLYQMRKAGKSFAYIGRQFGVSEKAAQLRFFHVNKARKAHTPVLDRVMSVEKEKAKFPEEVMI